MLAAQDTNPAVWTDGVYAFVVFAELEVVELGGFPPVFDERTVACCLVYSPGRSAVDATASSPRDYGRCWLCGRLILLYGRTVSMLSWSLRNRRVQGPCCDFGPVAVGVVFLWLHDQVNAVDATAGSPRGYGGDGRAVDVACSDLGFVRLQRLSCNRRICFGDEVSSIGEVEATSCQHACLSWSLRNWFVQAATLLLHRG